MQKRKTIEAFALTALLGVPLLVAFSAAFADGHRRHVELPFRAIFGDARFEAMMRGEGGFPHYLGRERRAPDFELVDRHGRTFKLSERRGRVVVMNFWSITCPPCVEEMPSYEALSEIAAKYGDVDVVAVSADAGYEAVRSVLSPSSKVIHLFDPEREVITERYGTELFPETWIIDRDGVVRLRYDGPFDWSNPVVLSLIERFR
ncbi:MAG: TlpA family protein disulfide reductase [Myxococcales bacterium]|jgi:peroxiredoxin|nr:TlpA family protein disulfide reductase [Myxococcales bacterium]